MDDCVFCKIAKGEIPSYKIYEDEDHIAFLDINPVTEGHTLVIPKKHYRWVWDIPKDEMNKLVDVVKKIVSHYKKIMATDFVAGVVWGLDLPHAHVQLFPKAYGLNFWKPGKLDKEKAVALVKELSIK